MNFICGLLSIALGFLARIFQAFVLTKIWLWFFVASFAWLPVLPLSVAVGMCFFLGLAFYSQYYSKEEVAKYVAKYNEAQKSKDNSPAYYVFINPLTTMFYSAAVLFVSWVFHFMF